MEAFGVTGIRMCSIIIEDHRADDYHSGPYADAKHHGMETPIEFHLLHFFKVMQEINGKDDDVDDEDHMHVNVDHAADHFTEGHRQGPDIHHVVVDAEGEADQEDDMDQDQVEKADGGPRAQV